MPDGAPGILGALKLVLLAAGLTAIAIELSLPYEGLLASLSIGGLAVAFASRETLSNIFGAGVLALDRPFRRGDQISAGGTSGVVEHVGIRSTRARIADDMRLAQRRIRPAHIIAWSLWRRAHQASARDAHNKARLQRQCQFGEWISLNCKE